MKITIITVGKIKEKYLKDAIAEYSKRLSKYCKLEIIEVADEKTPDAASETLERQIRQKEGERILKYVKEDSYVITLEIGGEMLDSVAFAKKVETLGIQGKSHLTFIIGGSIGLGEEVLKKSDYALSFSKMTFPHQLMRVILLEQIYRGYRITAVEHQEQPHKRRVRYKGTHPRTYKEKYKELQPEKYADTIEKVIRKGSTPAGMHISICVQEILDFLQIQPGQTGLDATLGYGGHSSKMLEQLQNQGHLYALDVDPIEMKKTKERLAGMGYGPEILSIKHLNFADVDQLLPESGKFNFALADLGVSSMQIDNPERGFTYKYEGPLDLRLNPEKGIPAAERLRHISQPELEGMLIENADEPYAKEISTTILSEMRRGNAITTTTQLQKAVEKALVRIPAQERKEAVKKSCARTFQALRIDVNSEFEVLEAFLEKLPEVMESGGRIAILTFHSGEDRLVKKSFQRFYREGIYSDIAKDVIRPSAEECSRNSRARSTKMRWAIRA